MNPFLKYGSVVLLFLLLLQLIRPDLNASFQANGDLLQFHPANTSTVHLLQTACYDCHSNFTQYPWYAQIAPFSWWIASHVTVGRAEINFSDWGEIKPEWRPIFAKKCVSYLEDQRMPLASYAWLHREARLSENQRQELIQYFQQITKNP